jgi:ABC transporter with metal-binding/Fe-S-binding domain ATP-binding protein
MNTAVLFSGGKDSTLALHYALQSSEVKCLVSVISSNPESFMFHTPNIQLVEKQAECIGLPLILQKTRGVKEEELKDLEKALLKAKKKFTIEGIYTGALASVYQASRIQKLCDSLGLKCINPLWQKNQFDVLEELQKEKIQAIIIGVFGQGLEKFLGRKIDSAFIEEVRPLAEKLGINPAGEGGEMESFVLDAPFFKKSLVVEKSSVKEDRQGGRMLVLEKIRSLKK